MDEREAEFLEMGHDLEKEQTQWEHELEMQHQESKYQNVTKEEKKGVQWAANGVV
ncbi:Hypothetical predicted protein [Olea europaea subsp. europaea]|uniref:Uncharacterized protein n=1 Tax=Olea europaea subsp. europaea TaxID=158383 RepID=A0A8S0TNE2_OLEEU|nr:Hypothetical predicted protein [Olea europaea subsp. europaea]